MLSQNENTLWSFILHSHSAYALSVANKNLITAAGCVSWTFIPPELEKNQTFPHRLPKESH